MRRRRGSVLIIIFILNCQSDFCSLLVVCTAGRIYDGDLVYNGLLILQAISDAVTRSTVRIDIACYKKRRDVVGMVLMEM